MALTSTMFTGLSGLGVNQTRLNVVGNNIANVNTVAFKASRALFKPQFYVTDQAGTGPSGSFGGTNPSQRGLGASVASIQRDLTAGNIEPTGKATDLAMDGNGYFILDGQERFFSRDGSFNLNDANELVSGDGKYVMGYAVDDNENVLSGVLGRLEIPLGTLTRTKATENATFTGNLNADGEVASGSTILNSDPLTEVGGAAAPTAATLLTNVAKEATPGVPLFAAGSTITLAGSRGGRSLPPSTFTIDPASTMGDLQNFFNHGMGLDPTIAYTSGPSAAGAGLATLPGDAATTARLIVTGNQGAENSLALGGSAFTISNGNALNFADGRDLAGNVSGAAGESVFTSVVAYDSLGTPLTVNMTMVLEQKTLTGTTWRFQAASGDDTDFANFDPAAITGGMNLGTGTVTFDNDGRLTASTGTSIVVDRADTGAASPAIDLDFSAMTALTDVKSTMFGQQDGSPIGTLTNFSIGDSGIITGAFSNGLSSRLGQVAVATFDNAEGLIDAGANLFSTGANSGEPRITAPMELTAGSIRSGALEMSNVDLSDEFVNLIIASTGFSAASRVISTSDRLMTELLQTAR